MDYTIKQIHAIKRRLGENASFDHARELTVFLSWKVRTQQAIQTQIRSITKEQIEAASRLVFKQKDADPLITALLLKTWVDFLTEFNSWDGMKLIGYYIWAGNQGGRAAHEKMNTGKEHFFTLSNDESIRRIQNRMNEVVRSIDRSTIDQVARYIDQGVKGLLTVDEIQEMIRDKFKGVSEARARTIAETELAFIMNDIEYETFIKSGVKQIRWVTVLDDRVSERDQSMHGQVRALGQEFNANDGWAGLKPPSHPNCRCFLDEVIEPIRTQRNGWLGA